MIPDNLTHVEFCNFKTFNVQGPSYPGFCQVNAMVADALAHCVAKT